MIEALNGAETQIQESALLGTSEKTTATCAEDPKKLVETKSKEKEDEEESG